MQKLILDRLENTGDESDENHQVHDQRIVVPTMLNAIADGFVKKENSWFATSQLPSDISIQVENITFYVHKYPLAARSGYISQIELHEPQNSHTDYDLKLEKFPGGSETFETILKFCYGLPISLNPGNAAALRCGSEFLEMTEAMEEGNLISKTEAFFTFVVLSSWNDTTAVLKSCETLSPWAPQKEAVSCKFLLRLLKMAIVYAASPALISELEKRIGMVLENASADDLLIPQLPIFQIIHNETTVSD